MNGPPEEDDNGYDYEIYACDAEAAAEKLAEQQDNDNQYYIAESGGVDINVKDSRNGEVKKFFISTELTVNYYATEKDK